MKAYVAVDIGASSGRLMLGAIVDGQLKLTEVHRFKNGFKNEAGHDRWQIDHIIDEIFAGLEKVKKMGYTAVELTLGPLTMSLSVMMARKCTILLAIEMHARIRQYGN